MKFFLLAFFSLYPFLQVNASTPKAVTCSRKQYYEEYIPGTESSPGYVKSWVEDVERSRGLGDVYKRQGLHNSKETFINRRYFHNN